MKQDAQCALDYLLARVGIDKRKIVLVGSSIGGAVAIDVAHNNQDSIRALIVENTFLSLPVLIPHVLPIAGYFTSLCIDKWQTQDLVPGITHLPVLFLASQKDELIPVRHMEKLFDTIGTKTKKFVAIPNAGHNDAVTFKEYWQGVSAFWEQHVANDTI